MKNNYLNLNEQKIAASFSQQAGVFDELYKNNIIVQYKRERVRDHIRQYISAKKSNILELNSFAGEDAIWLANEGHFVHVTAISDNLLDVLQQKVKANKLEKLISYELCSSAELNKLYYRGPYDMIFANSAALNGTGELDKALSLFSPLLKTGGIVTLVIPAQFCLWEFLQIFKGRFTTATRRLRNNNATPAKVNGNHFKYWYYKPSYISNHLKGEFTLLNVEGLCTVVPPSYNSNFAEKNPGIIKFLKSKENKWKNKWPWKYIGDYYIISLQKTKELPVDPV